ncbi:MAG TPA: tripartite tricarboxylate transporter substrate-binding protein [Beijerinckiaceae bacterium]|nr:tripartite tricarboxylate transporter substrate-binding protein [Beijerinckiaceae bacterium]
MLARAIYSGVLAFLLSLAAVGLARSQSTADFYKGRSVTILVGSGAGGGYDTYSRVLARYWGARIPGHPSIVVQNMPGANGVAMMNHLANVAVRDGTIIGSPFAANVIEPLVDRGNATKYDPRSLNWIGNIAPQYTGCFVRKDSPVKTLADAKRIETRISATGANSNSSVLAAVYNALLGTKFSVVSGYSASEQILAIERGEVDGTCVSYGDLLASHPDMIEKNLVTWLIVLNAEPVPELPGVPPATDFARNDEERQMLEFLAARNLLGRPYVVADGVPQDRVKALRASFSETMSDPAYLAETKQLRMEVEPVDHVAMEKVIADAYRIPASTIDKVIALTKNY